MRKNENGKYDGIASQFWENVEYALKLKGMTWTKLAQGLGVDPRTLSSRKSANANPSLGNAADIARQLDVGVDFLLYGDIKKSVAEIMSSKFSPDGKRNSTL